MPVLPFHDLLSLLILSGSLALCALLCLPAEKPGLKRQFGETPFPTVWDAGYTFLFLICFSLALSSSLFESGEKAATTPSMLIVALMLQVLLYLPMLVRYFTLPPIERPRAGLFRKLLWVAAALGCIFCCTGLMELLGLDTWLTELTHCPPEQSVVTQLQAGTPAQKLILAAAAVIMAPVCEECCFRGFLYRIMRQRSGILAAALADGLLFGAVHTSLVQLLPLTVFGVVQCLAYEKAKSLWLPICIHMLFNLCSVIFILFCA